MPTEHKKTKIKIEKADNPVKVKIKTEVEEVHALSHYVDDRVALVRQMFECLKSKTIKAMAPEFLQDKSLTTIQEQCLDEILGISKKRLLAIINATKCPSDTESSSESSDVENIIEHISLDEISSDSDAENLDASAKKNKKPLAKDQTKADGTRKSKKEISVLELLELQARARAIRSQLALEPVTKVELDSDTDTASPSKNNTRAAGGTKDELTKIKPKSKSVPSKLKSPSRLLVKNETEKPNGQTSGAPANVVQAPPRRVKLKRNFRTTTAVAEQSDKPEKSSTPATVDEATHKAEESSKTENTDDKDNDDNSPEVVTILPSPETFCISSDSDDEKNRKDRQMLAEIQATIPKTLPPVIVAKVVELPEEGEIIDEPDVVEHITKMPTEDKPPERIAENKVEPPLPPPPPETDKTPVTEVTQKIDEPIDAAQVVVACAASVDESPVTDASDETPAVDETMRQEQDDVIDLDDDVVEIDLHQTLDIPDEPRPPLKKPVKSPAPDGAPPNEDASWNTRWLGSSKITKIMATSRLGNKVREKIRRNKTEAAAAAAVLSNSPNSAVEPAASVEPKYVSHAEEGSVEQYETLPLREASGKTINQPSSSS